MSKIATDEQIQELRCANCGNPATCVGRYEDMPEPGDPACDECCGHGCEGGHCDPTTPDDFGNIDLAARARCAEILNRHASSHLG